MRASGPAGQSDTQMKTRGWIFEQIWKMHIISSELK